MQFYLVVSQLPNRKTKIESQQISIDQTFYEGFENEKQINSVQK